MAQRVVSLVAPLVFAAFANAQSTVPEYGQCGGLQYTGPTVCASGSFCTSFNPYYFQCYPGTASTSATTTSLRVTTTTTTSKTTTTTKPTMVSSTTTSSAPVGTATGTKYFITFGDSYSQTGFNLSLGTPSASNPEGYPPMPGFTTDNGLNWIGYLITELNSTLVLSYNFAYGGATTSASLVQPFESTVLCFDNQTAEFESSIASHPSTTPWTAENTLVAVWIGVNDVGNSYYQSNSTLATLYPEIMSKYFGLLQQIYNAGARNFAILNVPPIQDSPLMISQGTSVQQLEASVITQFNSMLASSLANFVSANPGSVGKIIDTQAPFLTVINNPTEFGATNATCYDSDGTTCVWWNNYHPGQAVHKQVAEAVASGWSSFF